MSVDDDFTDDRPEWAKAAMESVLTRDVALPAARIAELFVVGLVRSRVVREHGSPRLLEVALSEDDVAQLVGACSFKMWCADGKVYVRVVEGDDPNRLGDG